MGFILFINISMILIIILFLLSLYLFNCHKDKQYIKKCIANNEKLQLRVFEEFYQDTSNFNNSLVGIKLGEKNIIYNCTVFKRYLNIGPNYLLVEGFSRDDKIQEAFISFKKEYKDVFQNIILKV